MTTLKTINSSILAVLYYNLKKPDMYDLESQKDRKKAERNLKNSKNIDLQVFMQAYAQYLIIQSQEFATFLSEKKNNEKE